MKLVDTHCHIHESEFFSDDERERLAESAKQADVAMVCAATSVKASIEALDFCSGRDGSIALVGIHPHAADTEDVSAVGELLQSRRAEISGIGEIGLDYFYMNSSREAQIRTFEQQLQWASEHGLPVSFHVREAKNPTNGSVWEDFWPILDNFDGIMGVLHSFTDTQQQLERGFERGLYVGVNGISTFTKDPQQQQMYAAIPLERMLLETDAPFLTPAPLRGTMNEPSFVGRVAEHMATVRGVSLTLVSEATTANANRLFSI